MKWDSRLTALEWMAFVEVATIDCEAEYQVAIDRCIIAMFAHIPAEYRQSVTDAIHTGGAVGESLREWLDEPFAIGSPTIRSDFRFPTALVEFLLHPPVCSGSAIPAGRVP